MIVHVDPEENYLSVLSLPRDLRVDVPGHGMGKLNTAFAYGGAALAIRTIKQTTGVDVDHYLEIGFDAFVDMVNTLGGVYVDVDQRYFNDNWNYEPINVWPGYQLLSGADALDYVRFRHDTNMDFGRMQRQQRFMAAVREQAMGWDLPFKLPGLISALFNNVTTDLGANDILKLASWAIRLNGDNIRQITLTGSTPTIGGAAYVVVTREALAGAVNTLLNAGSVKTTSRSAAASSTTTTEAVKLQGMTVDVIGADGRAGEAGAAAQWLQSLGATVASATDESTNAAQHSLVGYPAGMLTDARRVAQATGIAAISRDNVDRITLTLGKDFTLPPQYALPASGESIPDADRWKAIAATAPFAVQAPAYLPPGYTWIRKMPDNQPTYNIDNIRQFGGSKPAFRMLYASADNSKQVMGITETSWLGAPAASPGLTVTHNGTVFTVVRTVGKVDKVWWKADGVLYWVSNTLSYWLDQEDMLKIAESMIPIPAR
jgi:LCP family protein required for cell wall assembly